MLDIEGIHTILIPSLSFKAIITDGGDLVSTWVTKLKAHAEDVADLVKNVTNLIVANKKRNLAVNDSHFSEAAVALAA